MRTEEFHTENSTIKEKNNMDEKALRIMQALSAVDESLLERSEEMSIVKDMGDGRELQENQNNPEKKRGSAKIFPISVWKIGMVVAAVVCVAVVGVVWQSDVSMDDASSGEMLAYTANTTSTAAESYDMKDALEATMDVISAEEEIAARGENGRAEMYEDKVKEASTEICEGMPKQVEITKENVYEVAVLGAYVPKTLPRGYSFESAYASGSGEQGSLTVCWSRGLDSIVITINKPETEPETIDIAKTEAYDEYLYEIPHAKTVPVKYWEVFSNPVCASEDFSLAFVEKRMISRGVDQGDTDTPRGNFAVLYPDGMVVTFSGRGTAEEIWEMFCSMEWSENN